MATTMVKQRAVWGSLGSNICVFGLALAGALSGCSKSSDGGDDSKGSDKAPSGGANADDCYSCGVESCPDEAMKCDELPVCATLRDCTLDCDSTDAQCKTDCTAAAAKDSAAVVAGANFIACATSHCPNECVASASTNGPTPGSGTDPSSSSGDLCQQLTDWAANCGADVSGQIPDCSALDATQTCMAGCIVDSSCADYQAAANGTQNTFTTCVADCVSGGDTPTSTPTSEVPASTEFYVAAGGYVTSGTWKGFAWTSTDTTSGSTIEPADYSNANPGQSLCATGTVVGTTDYSAVAMIGISLNQPNTDPAPTPGSWTPPSGSLGIGYRISNFQSVPLRIQIQAPGGDSDANLRYCAEVTDGGGTLSWSRFNTQCWDDSGTSYDGRTPLESIMLLVPGAMESVAFDICLQSISPQ